MSEVVNIPQLRFPEFSGEWVEKRGDEVFENISNKNHNSDLPILAITQEYGAIPRDLIDYKMLVSEKSVSSYKVVDIGDFIISLRSFQGGIEYSNYKGICSPAYIVLKPKTPIEDRFYKYFLKTYNYIQDLNRKLEGIRDGKMISYKYFSEINLPFPSLPEQQKIAAFLTAVDNKIELLGKKQALLKEYKKGLMQKIFTQEIRFKSDDGSEFPDWEEKKLGDVGNFKSGTGFTESEQGGKSGVPFLKVSDMNLEGNQKVMVLANNYVSDEQIARLNYKPINEKSIIFAKVGAAVFLERKRIANNFLIDNNMMAFTPTEDIGFIRQWFDTIRLSKYAQVGALPSYNASDLKTIKISLPSLEEQTKIANFLSSIDNKIEQVGKQLRESKQFKKALLQQMFV